MALRKQEQLYFVERMLVLLDAGLPLLESLVLMQKSASPAWQKIIVFIAHHLKQGERFSQCLSMQHAVFDPAFIGLIRVSEESGEINLALRTIQQQLRTQIEFRRQIRQALAYPTITLGSACLLMIAMLIWVIPVFRDVFGQFNASLPWATQLLLNAAEQFMLYLPVIGGGLALTAIGSSLLWLRYPGFQKRCDQYLLRIPIIGDMFRQSTLACWCRSLGYLMQAGLPALEAMRITAQTSNQWLSHDLCAHIFKSLAQGWSFGEALQRADPRQQFFDHETAQLLHIASASGSLATMLSNRADALERQLTSQLTLLSHSLEPILVVFVGLLIGGLVIILYLPIFNLGQIV
ncbi:MAG: type II secretion system F family protein [Polynucleobacter sp.]|nr:type II secretion system F family protein [Polynucleobacter sp.]